MAETFEESVIFKVVSAIVLEMSSTPVMSSHVKTTPYFVSSRGGHCENISRHHIRGMTVVKRMRFVPRTLSLYGGHWSPSVCSGMIFHFFSGNLDKHTPLLP